MTNAPYIDREAAYRDKVESCGCDLKYVKVGRLSFVPVHSEEEKKKGIFSWEIRVEKK